MTVEFWTQGLAWPATATRDAARAEERGWDGWGVVDSQNLTGDSYVALALAATATDRIGLSTAVTNPVTRHPAVTASAIASVQAASDGRAVLGVGRGDSALAHLGRAPASVAVLDRYLAAVQGYLAGDEVPFDSLGFHEEAADDVATLGLADTPGSSRLAIARAVPKVPVEVAATGPRVIEVAARRAERVMLAVGADPDRVAWGVATARAVDPTVQIGAFVNVVADSDVASARAMARGTLSTFARFNVMHGTTAGPIDDEGRSALLRLHSVYDMTHHTQSGSAQADALDDDFVDRFAIVGPPGHCVERLGALLEAGVTKVAVVGPSLGSDPDRAKAAVATFERDVRPALVA